MDQILEKIMNFINENTMLLIIICIFLIVILVIYLIDNTIKTKRLERMEAEKKGNPEEPTVIDNPIPEPVAPVVEETPVVETPVVEPVIETPVEPEVTIPEVPAVPEIDETPVPAVEEVAQEATTVPVTPVVDSSIDDLLNKDYSANNEVVENIPQEVLVEPPKSKYNNDKKLSDIFGKKKEVESPKKIETTQDFSDELDRILQKLNSEESSNEDESTDYTNMF
jgi:hypothetical protein